MATIEDLTQKDIITRSDLADLLASLGAPGENREAKLEAVKALDRRNFQGFGLEETIEEYQEY